LFERVGLCVPAVRAKDTDGFLHHANSATRASGGDELPHSLPGAHHRLVSIIHLDKSSTGLQSQPRRAKVIAIVTRAVGQLPEQVTRVGVSPAGQQS
jgi:hypothetical protein